MAISWSSRRQALYYAVATVILVIFAIVVWQVFFTHTPNCFDGTQNGTELGVDCGGACALVCPNDARSPLVLWARAFQTSSSTYTAAAYIQNDNTAAGARQAKYSFQLFDDQNILVVEKDGIVDLPPVRTIPIIEPNINVGSRIVARTLFSFSELPSWYTVGTDAVVPLRIIEGNPAADWSRLPVSVVNDSIQDAHNVVVDAVLFDASGVARAASKSILQTVAHKSSQDVVFTWPGGVAGIVKAEVVALPSF